VTFKRRISAELAINQKWPVKQLYFKTDGYLFRFFNCFPKYIKLQKLNILWKKISRKNNPILLCDHHIPIILFSELKSYKRSRYSFNSNHTQQSRYSINSYHTSDPDILLTHIIFSGPDILLTQITLSNSDILLTQIILSDPDILLTQIIPTIQIFY
jgi:hypothetical protein